MSAPARKRDKRERFGRGVRVDGHQPVSGQVDTNGSLDLFAFGVATSEVSLLSRLPGSSVATANAASAMQNMRPSVSADGQVVGFGSRATNLVVGQVDTNNDFDAFVIDRATGTATLVSRAASSAAQSANDGVFEPPRVSASGAVAAISSRGTNIIPGQVETNGNTDVFAMDLTTGAIRLVSNAVGSPTTTANNTSGAPSVSADGSVIAFITYAAARRRRHHPRAAEEMVTE